MKIGRFKHRNQEFYGIIREEESVVISSVDSRAYPLEGLEILPSSKPTKIIAVGLNYTDHARELDMPVPEEPVIFLKPPSAIIGHNEGIAYPGMSRHVDYEAELAVVIGKKCKETQRDDAYDCIMGYTCFNDVTARDLQQKDTQWTRSKSFDTFAPIGPYIVTKDEIADPNNLQVRLRLNDRLKQEGNTKNLIFDIPALVSFISQIMTLYPGDVIATGTPPGVGPMERGDMVEIEIGGIGVLKNRVV